MDDVQVGRALRRLRQERGWRQADAAARAGVSRSLYSQIERGRIGTVALDSIRRVAIALDARVALEVSYRGADLARLLTARHSTMVETLTRRLVGAGWEVRPEVSFSHFGERGVIDLVGWQAARRALLLVEVKTELADIGVLLATDDRRRRLAPIIATQLGWRPAHVSSWIVVAEGRTNRRRVQEFRTTLRAALPLDGHGLRGWLDDPLQATAALWFLSPDRLGGIRQRLAPTVRVARVQGSRGSDGRGVV